MHHIQCQIQFLETKILDNNDYRIIMYNNYNILIINIYMKYYRPYVTLLVKR